MAGAVRPPDFDLPEEVLSVLPTDPFEQLDVARKITSIALATRISALESEVSDLRLALTEGDDIVESLELAELRAKLETLDASLADISDQLARANDERETLLNENSSLSNTIKKLNRDVSRLEIFKKTLVQSLQYEEESPQGVARVAPKISEVASFSSVDDYDADLPQTKSSLQSQLSEIGSSASEHDASGEVDGFKGRSKPVSLLSSLGGTPRFTPPGSPPRRHSMSVATMRNMIDDRSSIFSSLSSSQRSSMSSPFDTGTQAGRTRVDGKEFFRQARSRLSYEQFNAFLSNVKELNAHKQSREETLRKAGEIFGPDNNDLYAIFEGLITRNLH